MVFKIFFAIMLNCEFQLCFTDFADFLFFGTIGGDSSVIFWDSSYIYYLNFLSAYCVLSADA